MLLVGYGALSSVHFDPHYYSEFWISSLIALPFYRLAIMLFDSKASMLQEFQFHYLY